jgi:hypothetical protein
VLRGGQSPLSAVTRKVGASYGDRRAANLLPRAREHRGRQLPYRKLSAGHGVDQCRKGLSLLEPPLGPSMEASARHWVGAFLSARQGYSPPAGRLTLSRGSGSRTFLRLPNYFRTGGEIMATASWKRPGSPIGKKGSRKANPKYKQRSGEPWSGTDVMRLKQLARQNTPTGVISLKLRRPPAAVRSKARREGVSLSPSNRSPYSRRRR